jgi:hypothetical protein
MGREAGFSAAQFAKSANAPVEMTELGRGMGKRQRQRPKQIPFGDDKQKDNGKCECNSNGKKANAGVLRSAQNDTLLAGVDAGSS